MRYLLKHKRIEKNFTQLSISKTIGIARNTYTQIETGNRNPSFGLSKKIKLAVEYFDDDLFDNT